MNDKPLASSDDAGKSDSEKCAVGPSERFMAFLVVILYGLILGILIHNKQWDVASGALPGAVYFAVRAALIAENSR